MDFDPESYDKSSFDTIQPARELIKLIKENNNNKQIPIVVDIGCGSGNTVKLLSDELDYNRIIGVDIDPEMIEFARINNNVKNSEYIVQDFSADWDDWDQTLKSLSGKVSVIFSNYALHWIRNTGSAAKNISKLLSNKGFIAFDVLYNGDIYANVDSVERNNFEKLLKYPTEQKLIGQWITGLKSAGFTRFDLNYWEPKSIYPEKYYIEEYIKIPINWYKQFLIDGKTDDGIDETIKKLIIKDRVKKLKEKTLKGEDMIEIQQQLWNFLVKK